MSYPKLLRRVSYPKLLRRMLAAVVLPIPLALIAAPTAVDDVFAVNEDTLLAISVAAHIDTDFEGGAIAFAGDWDFLDRIENVNGDSDDYPTDGSGKFWSATGFDTSSSTIGPWGFAPLPLQAGGVDGFPGAPDALAGIRAAGNGQNLVTTYLFRNSFVLTAAQAAVTDWSVNLLVDDSCAIYLNGTEVLRNRLPDGPLTTETLGSNNPSETQYQELGLDVSAGLLVAGTNVIAIEVHQTMLTSSDVGIDVELVQGGAEEGLSGGFTYTDDLFGTSAPNNSDGQHEPTSGFNGTGAVHVRTGGGPSGDAASSGAWTQEFTVASTAIVEISLRFRLVANSGFEPDESAMALVEIDGFRLGSAANGSLAHFQGDGNDGEDDDTGWQQRIFSLQLPAGAHTLDLGAYVSKSTTGTEVADVYFDDVSVGVIGGVGGNAGVLANDTGDSASLSSVLLSQPANGSVSMETDGTFSYTPDPDFFGDDTFTYRASDNTGNSSAATVTISVSPVNDAPSGLPGVYTTAEDQTLSPAAAGGVLQGASDVDNAIGQLVAVLDSYRGEGSLVLNPDGAFVYSPPSDFSGADSFIYRVSDGVAQSPAETVTITVTPVDDPPLAVADSYTVLENGQLVASVAQGSGGGESLEMVAAGAVWNYLDDGSDQGFGWIATTFNDASWESGAAQLGYGDGDETTVIGYGPDENAKYATTYLRRTFNVVSPESIGPLQMRLIRDDGAAVYLNGSEIARSNLALEAKFDTRADTSTGNENGWRDFEVDPELLVPGSNLLAIELHQHDFDSSDLSFDLSLTGTVSIVRGVLANDSDPEGSAVTALVEELPEHGTLSLASDGTFTYTPAANFFGTDTFEYRASDGGGSSIGTVTVTVIPGPNDVPVAVGDSYAMTEGQALGVDVANGVLSNDTDADGDLMEAELESNVSNGSLTLEPDGSFTYVPETNFFGADSFVYRASDGQGASANTTVTISVTGVNDPPFARPDTFIVQPGQVFAGNVLTNDTEFDQDVMTAVLTFDESEGQVMFSSDGAFTYDPAGFTGSTQFYYEAHDASTSSAEVQVSLIVNGRPAALADGYSVMEDETLSVGAGLGLLGNDSDPEGRPITAILDGNVSNGALDLESNGSFTYTPDPDYSGTDSFSYVASDGFQVSEFAVVTISVQSVNDMPVAVDDDYGVITNTEFAAAPADGVLGNDFDVDGDALAATLVTNVSNGVLALDPNGSFTYTPGVDFEGDDSFTYMAGDGSASSTGTVTLHIGPDLNSVVINEIMYHPASDNDLEEYIELVNIGTDPVDLSGWSFGDGVDFTFPAVEIPPGGFLVVAADLVAFRAEYGVIGSLVGGWSGRLSNSGERLRLYDDNGVKVDDVSYSDEGDWTARERVSGSVGWDWNSDHDGGGESLELRFPGVSNKYGQNWGASQGAPTPGAANTLATTAIAPMILDVEHSPVVPKSNEPVHITARLLDVEESPFAASLFWREAPRNPGGFSEVTMADDGSSGDGEAGDGVFGAILPAMPDGTVVEFYVAASDGAESRTWPALTNIGQVANAHYQVDDEVLAGHWPIYRIVMTAEEDSDWVGVNRGSNERFHATLILDDCSGPVIRYNSSIRVRGAGSRSHNPPPMRVSVPHDNPWNQRSAMNWNTKYTYLQYIGMRLFQGSGMAAPDGKPMRLRWNGEDRMRGDDLDYGFAVHMEVLNGDFVDEKYPDDKEGNLYKKTRPDRDWAFRNGDAGDYRGDGWSKETNADENDWSDLDQLLGVMNNSPGAGNYIQQVESVADLDQWMRWFGAMAILANGETNASTGADDDHSIFSGAEDPRFQFLPHDLDTILGKGDGSRLTDPQHTIFDMISRGDTLGPLVPLFSDPTVRVRYHQALRELLWGSFSEIEFNELINNSLIGWVPNGEINNIKVFMNARRTYINGLVDAELGAPPPAPSATTSSTLAGAHGLLMISEILAVNQSAFANGGTYPDYVELYNSDGSSADLGGMTMTDDLALPAKFTFPAGTAVPANGRLLVFADSDATAPGLHLGFGLGGNGDAIYLMNGLRVLDGFAFGLQIPDYSIGRSGAGLNTWTLTQPTPGSPNIVQPLGDPNGLRINEWLTQPEVVFERDFIELFNQSAQPVALGGMAITDEPAAKPTRFQMPALSFIAAGGFSLFEAIGSDASAGNASELPFKLGSDQGWLAISGVNGVEIDEVHYLCHRIDVSQGRSPDASIAYDDYVLPTPGYSNSTALVNESALVSGLRITDLMYHPAGGGAEYIELHNVGTSAIDLAGVAFTEGVQFAFPSMTLLPGEYVLVVEDQAGFEAFYGIGLRVAGSYSGKLSNGGERLRLEIVALGAGIHDFKYDDDWYPSTDGGGFALEIIDELANPGSWSERLSWKTGATQGGSPGGGGGDPAAYVDWVTLQFGAPAAGVTGELDDPDNDGVLNIVEFTFGTDPLRGDRGEMLELTTEGGFLSLTYKRAVASRGLVQLVPQISGDDKNWVAGGGLTVSELLGSDAAFETWRVRDATPIGVGKRRFLRIRVTFTDG